MSKLKEKLFEKIQEQRPKTQKLFKECGKTVIDNITVSQILGGMRGIKCLVTDISYLDPNEGIRYRGYTLPEVFEKLPKPSGAEMPYVEGLLYLLFTGDIPTEEEVNDVIDDLKKRRTLPQCVYDVIDAMANSHPMTIFSAAILAMSKDSLFRKDYNAGVSKMDYWSSTYEDALNLLAKLPEIGAHIYTKLYREGKKNKPDPKLDFGGDFANMIGIDKPYDDVSRMYFILHADHESGNVSAHTGHLVASSLSDIYLAISAMLNGLAGPLHGLVDTGSA